MAVTCSHCGSSCSEAEAYCDNCGVNFLSDLPFENLGESLPRHTTGRELRWYMGASDYAALSKPIRYIFFGISVFLGAMTSPWGHIYTTAWNVVPTQQIYLPPLYLFIFVLSYISPNLALISGLLFCLADFGQKLVVDDVYYPGSRTVIDYFLARAGYLFSYLSVFVAAVLPGTLARLFKYHGIRYTVILFRRMCGRAISVYKARRQQHGSQ